MNGHAFCIHKQILGDHVLTDIRTLYIDDICVDEACRGQGVGKALYAALERISKAQNITNLYACIGVPVRADEHLTDNSADFHAHMGYRLVGRFAGCGWKFGRRYDMVWMEKRLAAPDEQPAPLIPFPELEQRSLV